MNKISIDIETYSDEDLGHTGVYKYCDSNQFQVLLFAYAVDEGEVKVVDLALGEQIPASVIDALSNPKIEKWAYNASFERVCLSKLLGMPVGHYLNPKGWYCSMVWGASLGLPLGLAKIGEILKLDKQKLTVGKKLIKFFCTQNKDGSRNLPKDHLEDWEVFKTYNKRDVETEIAIQHKIARFPLPAFVWNEYCADQEINDRGVLVDVDLARAAVDLDADFSLKVTAKLAQLTHLENPNSVAQLTQWLKSQGVELDTLGKKDVAELIREHGDTTVGQVLKLRQLAAKSSVKKYQAMLRALCSDNRVRGMFMFYGATRTGRWAGRLVQLQNLPQNHIEPLEHIRTLVKRHDAESIEMLYSDVPNTLSQLIRTSFIARPGTRYVVADYSAIEARVIAWYAHEKWRQKVFAEGGDIYCASASQMFKVPVVKHGINGHLRQKGKIAELALGYGGSVGALTAMGALEMGLKKEELQELVNMWRASNPNIVKFWWAVDSAIKKVITQNTVEQTYGLMFAYESGMLRITLPSGRKLTYVRPRVINGEISYEGTVGATWASIPSYGPKFVENIVQGTARDVLCNAMVKLQRYGVVMHIHDELVIETDKLSLDEACRIMGETPAWAEGLLTRADGYETEFYKKD